MAYSNILKIVLNETCEGSGIGPSQSDGQSYNYNSNDNYNSYNSGNVCILYLSALLTDFLYGSVHVGSPDKTIKLWFETQS